MSVIVDTPIWSELLRRGSPNVQVREAATILIESGEAVLLGPIRQEVLSGVKDPEQFARLRTALTAFPDPRILVEDYELAAEFSNRCRQAGIQGSGTDFLLCSIANRLQSPIFTLDQDFQLFARVIPVTLFD